MKRFLLIVSLLIFSLASPVSALAATLSLSPTTGTHNKGCNFSVDIILDTGGVQTDGTDAILKYDNSKITATSITSGTIYADYPGNSIDDTTGKVTSSGLASISSAFSGKGTLATVNFTVKEAAAAGATIISFDFDSNNKTNTTDSNVVQRGSQTDILSSVTNGNYTIGTGACGTTALPNTGIARGQTGTPSAGQGQTQSEEPITALPPAGSEQFTFTLAIVGSVLTILGILGLALL